MFFPEPIYQLDLITNLVRVVGRLDFTDEFVRHCGGADETADWVEIVFFRKRSLFDMGRQAVDAHVLS
jgi:hypothetical protein